MVNLKSLKATFYLVGQIQTSIPYPGRLSWLVDFMFKFKIDTSLKSYHFTMSSLTALNSIKLYNFKAAFKFNEFFSPECRKSHSLIYRNYSFVRFSVIKNWIILQWYFFMPQGSRKSKHCVPHYHCTVPNCFSVSFSKSTLMKKKFQEVTEHIIENVNFRQRNNLQLVSSKQFMFYNMDGLWSLYDRSLQSTGWY